MRLVHAVLLCTVCVGISCRKEATHETQGDREKTRFACLNRTDVVYDRLIIIDLPAIVVQQTDRPDHRRTDAVQIRRLEQVPPDIAMLCRRLAAAEANPNDPVLPPGPPCTRYDLPGVVFFGSHEPDTPGEWSHLVAEYVLTHGTEVDAVPAWVHSDPDLSRVATTRPTVSSQSEPCSRTFETEP